MPNCFRCLQKLDWKDAIVTMATFAQIEFRYGDIERGKTLRYYFKVCLMSIKSCFSDDSLIVLIKFFRLYHRIWCRITYFEKTGSVYPARYPVLARYRKFDWISQFLISFLTTWIFHQFLQSKIILYYIWRALFVDFLSVL